jgi:hypothetical protein
MEQERLNSILKEQLTQLFRAEFSKSAVQTGPDIFIPRVDALTLLSDKLIHDLPLYFPEFLLVDPDTQTEACLTISLAGLRSESIENFLSFAHVVVISSNLAEAVRYARAVNRDYEHPPKEIQYGTTTTH